MVVEMRPRLLHNAATSRDEPVDGVCIPIGRNIGDNGHTANTYTTEESWRELQ